MKKGGLKSEVVFLQGLTLLFCAFLFLKLIFPFIAQWIVGSPQWLPVPGTLLSWYMALIFICYFIYITSDQEAFDQFMQPIIEAIRGRGGIYAIVFKTVFVVLPLFVGFKVFSLFTPTVEVPPAIRQQHPGMSGLTAGAYNGRKNPLRNPTPEMLEKFRQQYAAAPAPEGMADALPKKVDIKTVDEKKLKELFFADVVFKGRQLYHKNCRPCHGTGHSGQGPMARIFKLKPVAFTDPGTIATLVEDSVFWRVSEGGIGLPVSATPWDSPMPKWGDELTEIERWEIITALYHDIDMQPRVLEMQVEQ